MLAARAKGLAVVSSLDILQKSAFSVWLLPADVERRENDKPCALAGRCQRLSWSKGGLK